MLSQSELSLKDLEDRLGDPLLVDGVPSEVRHLDSEGVLECGVALGGGVGLRTRLVQLVLAEDAASDQGGDYLVDTLQRLAAHDLGAQLLKHDHRIVVDVVVCVGIGEGVVDLEDATSTHIARNECGK